MPTFQSTDVAVFTLFALAPGLVLLYFRALLLDGRLNTSSSTLLGYLVFSGVYYSLAWPLVELAHAVPGNRATRAAATFILVFVGPALVGIVLGKVESDGLLVKALSALGLKSAHPVPTAWDYAFGRMQHSFVLVTLVCGTRYAGWCADRSFMSSEPGERDMLIEKVYNLDSTDRWIDDGDRAVLIVAGQIRTVEFLPPREPETS